MKKILLLTFLFISILSTISAQSKKVAVYVIGENEGMNKVLAWKI